MGSEASEDGDTREDIMRATYRALCEHGYANLTMQDIADEFDKSKSLLHYHYDTKEDLLLAFLDFAIGYIGDRLAESDTEDPVGRLDEYLDKFVIDPDREHRWGFALALLELRLQAVHNEAFREKLRAHYEGNVEAAASIIEDGIEEGAFVEVDPHATGEMLYSAMQGAQMYQVTLDADGASEAMRDAIEEFVVSSLRAA